MGSRDIGPETLEERLVYWTILWTWGLWLLGGLYFAGPLLGFALCLIVFGRFLGLSNSEGRPAPALPPMIPLGVMLWIAGVLAMLLALVVAHLDYELGTVQLIKSVFGWAKGWALLAVFTFAGAMLSIRPSLLYRATGILAIQTLVLIPIFMFAGLLGFPESLYVSPLSLIGGPGPEFFDVSLYSVDNISGRLRWRFFSPWSTAAALIAAIGIVFATNERSYGWRLAGVVSAVLVCFMSGSRLAIIALPLVAGLVLLMSNGLRPAVLVALALTFTGVILLADYMLPVIEELQDQFTSARAASSHTRATLNAIGLHRWQSEAVWFGHGIVERGPHLVHYMPIGSHHTWYGLLFVKGVVGFLALAVPLAWSIVELTVKAWADRVARAGLGVMLTVLIFSFADNLEIVAYLIWPGMIVVGICLRRPFRNPYAGCLGASAPQCPPPPPRGPAHMPDAHPL